jgi:tRNA(His) 5'-end guanylyltransferase
MRFEKSAGQLVLDDITATYLLYQQADELRIVLQLDHQDLMRRVKELGLLPGKG